MVEYDIHWQNMIYTLLLSLLLAEYAANQKCSAVLLCSADSIYPRNGVPVVIRPPMRNAIAAAFRQMFAVKIGFAYSEIRPCLM